MNRETWLKAVADRMAPWFDELGERLPPTRIGVGFTGRGKKSKAIGECWPSECSKDGTFEIFIVPTLDEPVEVAAILAHELTHAAVGLEAKHGKPFKRVARGLGLEGKMKATYAGDAFKARVAPILADVGPFPHARLGEAEERLSSGPAKQKNRHIKCACIAESCGYVARVTMTHLARGAPLCPEHKEPMQYDLPEDDESDSVSEA